MFNDGKPTHTFDKPSDLDCNLTQNVQNTNKAISPLKQSAKKQQDLKTKLDSCLPTQKKKNT